jgi:transforming growth factor-beta-induced protein
MRHRLAISILTGALAIGVIAAPAAAKSGSTIVDTAIAVNGANGEFTYLIQAVVKAGLVETLDGKRQFTVFAPTDAAFEDLFDTLGVDGIADIPASTLKAVLLYHVAPGERFSGDVLDASRVRTMSKSFLRPSIQGGDPYISGANNSAEIVLPDVDASNGVIHVIDAVLLP